MKILEYIGLDTARVKAAYRKVADAIARDDFHAAQVKKLANLGHGKFYRARLDGADRLLFSLVRHGDQVYALMLEVINNHDYDKSRFLRGAAIDEAKIPDIDVAEAVREAQAMRYLHPQHTAIHLLDKPISFDDTQQAIYRQPAPLIVVGSAGSGKTALTLEKSRIPPIWPKVRASCTTPTVLSMAGKRRASCPTVNSLKPCACRWAGRRVDATLPPGLAAVGKRSRRLTRIRRLTKSAA
jgi:hypothetical protein